MTERFKNPVIKYTTDTLKTLPGALLYFYENGTTTPKTIYADPFKISALTNPVVADSAGIFVPIFLDGTYTAELKSAAGVTQTGWPVDNVGGEETGGEFDDYSAITSYTIGNIVTGSNGLYYISQANGNLNRDPTIGGNRPTWWVELKLNTAYNAASTYEVGEWVTFGGLWYLCKATATAQTPAANSAFWELEYLAYSWNSTTTFGSGAYCYRNGIRYLSQQAANLNQDPSTDTTYTWWKPEVRINLESNQQVIKVRPLTGGGALLAEWCNVLKDAGTYTLPLANSVPANTLIIITKSDTARNLTPAFDCSGADTIAYLGGTATGINIDVLWDDSIILYSNGTNQWSA